ncbi:MAG: ATP-grasp domain-containing protein [Sphingopyxis sp.]|jgi:glutathione synthase/RimK-type ligase-like ATP-grasp enzyme|uniref:ATP-grasp domain-containing protein n=1 Tax=Sphingopyxis sp. TaxID=1908224 RepID=UPI003F6E629F
MPFQPRVAILVPAPDYYEKWQPAFARKAAALTAAGLIVEQRVWTDPGDLSAYDLVLPLFAWGYQRDVAGWYALLDRLEEARLPVVNPVPVLRWNSDKAYLGELGAKGVAVVPTVEVDALDDASLTEAMAELATDEVVIKPAISGGADGTHRIAPGAPIPADAKGARRLVQPLMPGILTDGEYSLFFFAGKFSHAIVKRPASGDFRVQEQFGGRETACEASDAAQALAAQALAAAPAPPVYARVDMVSDAAGKLHIMELELIEPSLFLHHAPDKGAAFGLAVAGAIAA